MMPVERYHLEWAQRTNNLWTLPAILRSESGPPPRRILAPARVTQLDAMQHRWMVEDLTHWQPELVLVQRCQDPRRRVPGAGRPPRRPAGLVPARSCFRQPVGPLCILRFAGRF
jgi:hypothetical protein